MNVVEMIVQDPDLMAIFERKKKKAKQRKRSFQNNDFLLALECKNNKVYLHVLCFCVCVCVGE